MPKVDAGKPFTVGHHRIEQRAAFGVYLPTRILLARICHQHGAKLPCAGAICQRGQSKAALGAEKSVKHVSQHSRDVVVAFIYRQAAAESDGAH